MAYARIFKHPLLPLCLLILIDHMGFAIIYPILVPVFMDSQGAILGIGSPENLRSFWYGITLSIFPITTFFGATLLGGLSDQLGRKKILMICLIGACIGYTLSGLAVDLQNVSLLIFSRAIAGLAAGSMPIAQAAVIDLSDEHNKASNLGFVIFFASFGFLLGPLIGGFFANNNIIVWFHYSTPFYFSALLTLLNLSLLTFFKETFVPKQYIPLSLSHSINFLIAPFRIKSIQFLAGVFLFMQLGWSFYFQFISIYLLKKYHFSSQDLSLFMTLIGIGFAIGSCWVVRIVTKYLVDNISATIALGLATLCIFLTIYDIHNSIVWAAAFILGITMSTAYSILIKLFSGIVAEQEQGWIMGVSEAIIAVAWAITPLLSSYLEKFGVTTPLTAGMSLLLISTIMLKYWKPFMLKFRLPKQRNS